MLSSDRNGKYNMDPCYELICYWVSVIYHVCISADNDKLQKLQCNVITLKWWYYWYMALLTYVNICFFLVRLNEVCWIWWEYVDSALSHSIWTLRSHIFEDLSIFHCDKFTYSVNFSESSQSYGPWQIFMIMWHLLI